MRDLTEIRWHGRAGQGIVTAAVTLADILATRPGTYVQAFPEFGAEKRGAPILAFNRISRRPIRTHAHIERPDVVVVADPSLLGLIDVAEGARDDALVLLNTAADLGVARRRARLGDRAVWGLDATAIALAEIGRPVPNVPLLSALVKVAGLMDLDPFRDAVRVSLARRLKPEVVAMNLRTIDRALQEVRRG